MLTPKQQRFVDEYLIDLNATQAAIRAGYSKKTAYSQGQRLLKHVEVSQQIATAAAEHTKAAGIDTQWLMDEAKDLYEECRSNNDRPIAKGTLDMLGKWAGLADTNVKHDHTGTIEVVTHIDAPPGSDDES